MNKYKLGILVFNENTDACIELLRDLKKQLKPWSSQITIRVFGCDEKETEWKNLKKHGFTIYPDKSEKTILQAVREADAEYIHMTMSSAVYTEEFWKEIFHYLKQDPKEIFMTKAGNWNPSAAMKEHNYYMNIQGTEELKEKSFYVYHLIHCLFYAYFVRSELFRDITGDEELSELHWSLPIVYWYSCLMPMQKEIGMIPKAVVRIQGQGDPFVWKTLAGISQFSCFFRHFVMPYYEFCKAHADSLNAKYNLLYYLKKLLVYAPKDEEEIKAIKESSDEIFTFIKEEELILENQYFDAVQKIYMLKNFNWDDHNSAVYREKKKAIMDGRSLENMLMFFHMGKKYVRLEGRTMMFGEEPFEIFIRCGKQLVPCKLEKKVVFRNWFHQDIARSEYYSCKIPHVPGQTLRMSVVCKKGSLEIEKRVMSFSTYTPFSGNVDLFERKDGWIADVDRSTGEILVFPDTGSNRAKVRIKRELSFLKGGKAAWKAIAARLMYKVFHTVKNKEIWLISDRINRADDNGECFFRYLSEHPQENVVPYFVIEKGCPEYKRMKAYGKVIPVYSWRHKMAHLLCDYIVSSQANKPVINPYGRISCFYKDLMYDKKFVFLQHGVTKDDQSAWLNRYSRNLYGFVVATKAEYQSIFDADYYYPEKNVWLTGMPRYDRLYRDEQKYITIMPTWRKSLSGGVTAKGEWTIGDTFAESNYFKFYNALLSHPRLLDAAQERGYQVCFMPHPNITPAIPLFDHDPRVNFWQADKSYRDVFAQSDLIVTDYSSVAFDFAYLRKPLVYAQFDREEFFSGSHSYTEGYYNYQTDGFGEIKENMEDLVDCLIEYMDNGCQLKEEYRERIERTFAFADQNCCARVLERMLEKHEK